MGQVPAQVKLNARLRVVHSLYFGQGLTQVEIAHRFGIKQPSVAYRVRAIRRQYALAGLTPPPTPGRGLELLTPLSLSFCRDRY
jgi:hypothetical protein